MESGDLDSAIEPSVAVDQSVPTSESRFPTCNMRAVIWVLFKGPFRHGQAWTFTISVDLKSPREQD